MAIGKTCCGKFSA